MPNTFLLVYFIAMKVMNYRHTTYNGIVDRAWNWEKALMNKSHDLHEERINSNLHEY